MDHERREYLKANNMNFTLAAEDDGAALDGTSNSKLGFSNPDQWDDGLLGNDYPKYEFNHIKKALKEIEGNHE